MWHGPVARAWPCGVAVVQSLRNYRLLCPGVFLFRDNDVCESCLRKTIPWPAIAHACYRDSRAASTTVVLHNTVHRLLGTWRKSVDRFFTPLFAA